jgi:hypothetical protein
MLFYFCEEYFWIWGSHIGDYEDIYRLEYEAI